MTIITIIKLISNDKPVINNVYKHEGRQKYEKYYHLTAFSISGRVGERKADI